jgi:hypothetical protein
MYSVIHTLHYQQKRTIYNYREVGGSYSSQPGICVAEISSATRYIYSIHVSPVYVTGT